LLEGGQSEGKSILKRRLKPGDEFGFRVRRRSMDLKDARSERSFDLRSASAKTRH
jgi:hypothetical protein